MSRLKILRRDVSRQDADATDLAAHAQQIRSALRELAGIVGQLVVAAHWQSPAVRTSGVDQSGPSAGHIIGHYNDYTRDRHELGAAFEAAYRREYLRVPRTIPTFAYATSSGMAAMTVAAHFVLGETDKNGIVLVAASCYFETKQLLTGIFGTRLITVDLSVPREVTRAFSLHRPVAIFTDTVGNEPNMRRTDVPSLIRTAAKSGMRDIIVVADVSASAFRVSIIPYSLRINYTLIGVESQNKFLQFGSDRVTAGVVWGTGYRAMRLYDYRDHAGLNCPDAAAAALPTPNRRMATRYIGRLERNTNILLERLAASTGIQRGTVSVAHSGGSFIGAYVILSWKSGWRSYERYIRTTLKAAEKEGIPLVEGTSFGLPVTRVYTVARGSLYETAFLRISPGTEYETAFRRVAEVLCAGLPK